MPWLLVREETPPGPRAGHGPPLSARKADHGDLPGQACRADRGAGEGGGTRARDRGLEVAGGSAVRGRPGRLVWAGLLDDLGADPEVTRALFGESGPLGTTMAVRLLTAGNRRLIVVDDVDAGGQEAV